MTNPAVSIILLNYKGREDTLACLRSLEHLTYPNFHVILVDNDSADGTPEAVRIEHPNVAVIESGATSALPAVIISVFAMRWSMARITFCC